MTPLTLTAPTTMTLALAAVLAAPLIAGCHSDVVSLSTEGQAPPSIPAGTTLAALSDNEATELCSWFVEVYPQAWAKPPQVSQGGIISNGYVDGAFWATTMVPTTGGQFSWPLLDVNDCVRNLRHAPCAATIGTLEGCVQGLVSAYPDARTVASTAPCTTFYEAPDCQETVFQTVATGDGPCAGSLPIEANVTCHDPGTVLDAATE